ncbi:hypothetical protein [Methanoregula sp. UBA64]|jgi:hypothetical protein|uniref:hypothetical protein n=1 Tax=Methanoregula sp. UBA64 TaxID=1915554 RepID=UPI0025E170BE|nr:hypothetical protein [Methanoregula sp. UBA64]
MTSEITINFESYLGPGDKWNVKEENHTTHIIGSQEHYIGIKGTNSSDKPIVISSWGFELPNTNYITEVPVNFPGVVNFPITLAPYMSVSLAMSRAKMAKALKEAGIPDTTPLVGFVKEKNGTTHRKVGNPFNKY